MHASCETELRWRGLPLALSLAVTFLLASQVQIVADMGSALFGGKVIESVFAEPIWSTSTGRNLARYAFTQVGLHVALGGCFFLLARLSVAAWPRVQATVRHWVFLWAVGGLGWILLANATWFPWSRLGLPYAVLARSPILGVLPIHVFSTVAVVAIAITLAKVALSHRSPLMTRRASIAATAALVLLGVMGLTWNGRSIDPGMAVPPAGKPHVIIVGIDSLRFDATGPGGGDKTPNIDAFLAGATTFQDATTPLARTFPAWVSLLTGRHPHSTGAVVNLLPRSQINEGATLPGILRRVGYRTIYAIDEVRFSNLDGSYGFDKTITPPIGATDFLLGFFADSPLSNLITNSALGGALFPYGHANRAAAATYDPDTFIERLDDEIRVDGPTFMAVHLTLAHWPYSWADSPLSATETSAPVPQLYDSAVRRVDRQFSDLMALLRHKGLLDNTIMLVLSDHGEALGLDTDLTTDDQMQLSVAANFGSRFGHGTSVLAPAQYRVLLSIRGFGPSASIASGGLTLPAPSSLLDVTPTLLDALDLAAAEPMDGQSLLPVLGLTGGVVADNGFANRIRFTETEFNPRGIVPGTKIEGSAIVHAAAYYRVDSATDRLELRPEFHSEMLRSRQYAAFSGRQLLAAIPELNSTRFFYYYFDGDRYQKVEAGNIHGGNGDARLAALWDALHTRFPDPLRASSTDASRHILPQQGSDRRN